MRSKLTLMLVALLAMAGIATAQTPKKKPLRRSISTSLPDSYDSNDKVAFGVWHDESEWGEGSSINHYSGFDIRVKGGESWYSTTYYDEGYATVIQVEGGSGKKMIYGNDKSDGQKFAFGKTYTVDGIQVSITAQIPEETPDVVEITYHVKNTNSVAKTIDLGSCADTQVGENDRAQVNKSGNKITVSDGTVGYSLVVRNSANPTAETRVWFGSYRNDCYENVFSNSVDGNISDGTDTATAWSWHFTLEANGEADFVVGGEEGAAVVDNTGTVSMSNYTYGTATSPSVIGYSGTPEITYYYNTTNINQGGTPWSLDAGRSLNAGTYYMYAKLAATDGYNAYTTAAVPFTVNPIVYVAGSSSDAIDLNVPANLGQMDGTNGPTDLAAFLEEYQKIHVNPAYIKLTLEPSAKYVISRPLTTMSAITIVGDEKNPAIIDASLLGANPFVIIDRNHQVNEKNEKGFLTSIYNVEFKNFIVEKAQGSLFSSNGQKYDIPYMTIDNVVYEAVNDMPLISLNGGIVENLTMTRSTAFTFGNLYDGNGSAKLAEAGVNSQKFTFSYNTLVKADELVLVHADASESAKRTINVDHNVIIEPNANFVTGLNAGDANCIVQYNAFLSTSGNSNANGDYVYNDISNTEDANGAAGSIKGNMVWVNTKKIREDLGDWVINFPMGDCPQRDAKIGDPRWLSAKMRIKEADVDDDNDLAKVINEGVKKGYTEFELVQNQYGNLRYTVKQSIVTDKAISITGENVQIDVEHSDPFIQLSTTPAEAAVNDYFRIDQMLLKGLEIKGIKNSIIYDNNTKYCVVDLTIDDCVLGLETEAVKNEALISFQAGGAKDFTIKNSTVYGNNAVAKYFIRYNNSARLDRYGFDKNTEFQTMTYQNNTFYGLLKSDGQWGNYNGIAGQNYSKFVVEKNIWYNSSNEIIRRMAGGRFGGNAPQTFDKNTYFLNGADNSAKEAGYDKSGTALTTDPGFKKPAEGDFTLSAYSAQCNEQTGDPRWFAEGGHYNPVTGIETVKTAEETSLENAVIYNLNGQRVEKAQKGINIVNGKKVVIK